jgi:hypothetical protein
MRVQLAHPSATPQQLEEYLRSAFPRYSVTSRAGIPIVGDGAATGIMLKPDGAGGVNLAWAFPSMALQMVLSLTIVATGILPGLLVYLIVWLSVKGGVERLKQEVSTVLAGGAPMQAAQAAQAAPGAGPAPPRPGPYASIGAGLCLALALLGVGQTFLFRFAMGGGNVLDALSWIAIAVGAFLVNGDETRSFQARAAIAGPGKLVLGIAAIVHGLLYLPGVAGPNAVWVVRALLSGLFWLAAGGLLIAAHASKAPSQPKRDATLLTAGGVVLLLLGLFAFYDVYFIMEIGASFGVIPVAIGLRALLMLGLGGVVLGRAGAARRAPEGVVATSAAYASAPGYPQPAYAQQPPQQAYPQTQTYPQQPQQAYPQQAYPQQPQQAYPQQPQQAYPQQAYPQQPQQAYPPPPPPPPPGYAGQPPAGWPPGSQNKP